MKANTHRNIGAAVLLLGGLVGVSSAQAVVINGVLQDPRTSTDAYWFTCPEGTISARANVTDQAPVRAPFVSVQIARAANTLDPAANATDLADGDAAPSSWAMVVKGPGPYLILVDKAAVSPDEEFYRLEAQCGMSGGFDPGAITQLQNQ